MIKMNQGHFDVYLTFISKVFIVASMQLPNKALPGTSYYKLHYFKLHWLDFQFWLFVINHWLAKILFLFPRLTQQDFFISLNLYLI